MLTELEQTKRALAGKHRAIDDWLDARQALLVEYMRLAGKRGPLGRFCTAKPDGKSHVLAVGVWDTAEILKWLDKMERKQWKS